MNMDVQSPEDLIHAQYLVFHHCFSYVKSMALKCAVDLGISDAIHSRGCSATLSEIVAGTWINASRMPYVQRLMHFLSISGVFVSSDDPPAGATASSQTAGLAGGEAVVYKLTPTSRLLCRQKQA
ncbi:hypothetical protein PR202_ga28234 [Eleusine coracana subsp. coracana]|uniref:O-methyltransferase dimerisation domain-containing protein n=1 Tax=Eleusine coracana subsp. coracana TaxID=191504 RepID=A0AAV5DJS4_ELECO|nr:hypothetical protein PR202_ga28234 [Eleusine coracana subsp. coracana]